MKRFLSLACALVLCLVLLPATASADMGPKPAVTITVENAPQGLYYLDLLIPAEARGRCDNLQGDVYDAVLLDGLHSWEGEGWYPAFAGGTNAPLFGDLVPDGEGVHRFSYFGLPETFRIAVSTASGAQAAETPYTRTAFYTGLVYDYAANTVTERIPGWQAFLVQLAATLVPTLLVEGALLLLFGFKLRENLLVFLSANLITQAGLHLALGNTMLGAVGSFFLYLLILLPAEAVICAAEAAAFALLLKGRTRARRVGYALTANAASLVAGFLALRPLMDLLRSM